MRLIDYVKRCLLEDIFSLLYSDQWCQTDIRESGVQERGQIEECWLKARKIVIRQSISLQMLSAIDIRHGPTFTPLMKNDHFAFR